MIQITAPSDFCVIAHRGASGYAPENTRAAFQRARDMQVTDIEFDLQLSSDGEMIVVHDRVLDRYGHPGCAVADMTLAELRRLDMGRWFGRGEFAGECILTASELFEEFGESFRLHAEIKAPSEAIAQALADALMRLGLADRTVVTSFDFPVLEYFHRLMPTQPLGWLARDGGFTDENVKRTAAAGINQFCPSVRNVTPENVAQARRTVGQVRAHGIKNREDAEMAIRSGCDGMTINWPDWIAIS